MIISTDSDKHYFYHVKIAAIILIAVLAFYQIYLAVIHPYKIGWDTALHLQAAQLITRGKIPYVDMLDVNPPLIWYIDTIPAFASNIFNLPATLTFSFFLTSIIVYSAAMSLYLLLKSKSEKELVFAIPFVLGLIVFNFFLRWDIGQREDIFVLLYLPFFLLRWLRWNYKPLDSKPISIIVGVIGGVGICLKPHFLIPSFLVELYFLLDKKNLKALITIETVSAVMVGVVYLAHFLFVPAQMRENYFGFLVPAFKLGYSFWDVSMAQMFSAPDKRNVFFLMAIATAFSLSLKNRSTLFLPLTVFAIASNIPYLIQFKGWAYHDQPVYAVSTILGYMVAGYFIYEIGKSLAENCYVPKLLLLYLVPVTIAGIVFYDAYNDTVKVNSEPKFSMSAIGSTGTSPRADLDSPFLKYFEQYYRKGDSVVFMSNGVTPGYPTLTQLDCKPGSRHLHCVILSVLQYVNNDIHPKTKESIAIGSKTKMVVEQYGEDIKNNKPKLIFVQMLPVEEYLKPYNFEEKYLTDYEKIDEVANFKIYLRRSS